MQCKILVVDDNEDFARSIALLLEQHGWAAISSTSVRAAADILDEDPSIGLVLTDVRMPEMSGLDLRRVLRHRFPKLPVVLMTGLPDSDDDPAPQGHEVLQKPIAISELLRVVKERLTPPSDSQ